jgi:hypothetical protein
MGMCGELLMTLELPSEWVWLRSVRLFRSVSKKQNVLFGEHWRNPAGDSLLGYVGDGGL